MRNAFFTDRKDVLKWSVTLEAAHRITPHRAITYVAMMRPDGAGWDFREVSGARADVVDFFDKERARIQSHRRDVGAVRALIASAGCELHLISDHIRPGTRAVYFDRVTEFLRKRGEHRRDVVLIDPDNGFAASGTKDPALGVATIEELALVWGAMVPGDVLIVYQHSLRERNWQAGKQKLLGRAVEGAKLTLHDGRDFCLFEAEKV